MLLSYIFTWIRMQLLPQIWLVVYIYAIPVTLYETEIITKGKCTHVSFYILLTNYV